MTSENVVASAPVDATVGSIEDRELPKSILARLSKTALPEGLSVQKDARTALSRSSTVFISYITAIANDIAVSKNRKTILYPDILAALEVAELDQFIEQVKEHVHSQKEKKKQSKQANKEKAAAAAITSNQEGDVEKEVADEEDEDETEEDEEDANKKTRYET